MASVVTAAFDPIFWLHHANIDRLWSEWDCMPQKSWGTVPPQSWLNDSPWEFYDVDLTVKKLSRLDYLTSQAVLGSYDTDDPTCQRLSRTPLPQTSPQPFVPFSTDAFVIGDTLELGVMSQVTKLSADTPVSKQIPIKEDMDFEESNFIEAMKEGPDKKKLILELKGLDYDSPPSVGFDVYVNMPANGDPITAKQHFVGSLNLFGLKHQLESMKKPIMRFDITEISKMKGFDYRKVAVTIVPFDLLKPTSSAPPLRQSGGMLVKSMSIVIAENLN